MLLTHTHTHTLVAKLKLSQMRFLLASLLPRALGSRPTIPQGQVTPSEGRKKACGSQDSRMPS